jgi:hypothetical protein
MPVNEYPGDYSWGYKVIQLKYLFCSRQDRTYHAALQIAFRLPTAIFADFV